MLASVAIADAAAACDDGEAAQSAEHEYLWQSVQTQWRMGGMGGPTGLDYAGVRAYLDECALAGQERQDAFAGICAAEHATLAAWADARRDKRATQPPN